MPRGRKKGDNYLDPVRSLLIARLLLEGVSQRETAARARANREAVKRIQVQLVTGDGAIFGALERPARMIRTVHRIERPLATCLVRHSAISPEPIPAVIGRARLFVAVRRVHHEEILVCLVRQTAIALARQGESVDVWLSKDRARHRPELVTAAELAAVLPADGGEDDGEPGKQGATVRGGDAGPIGSEQPMEEPGRHRSGHGARPAPGRRGARAGRATTTAARGGQPRARAA